jgi:hypothetical protein
MNNFVSDFLTTKTFFKLNTYPQSTSYPFEVQCGQKILENIDKALQNTVHHQVDVTKLIAVKQFILIEVFGQAN